MFRFMPCLKAEEDPKTACFYDISEMWPMSLKTTLPIPLKRQGYPMQKRTLRRPSAYQFVV